MRSAVKRTRCSNGSIEACTPSVNPSLVSALNVHPFFVRYYSDPRFLELCRKTGLHTAKMSERNFFAELKRRNVVRAAAFYAPRARGFWCRWRRRSFPSSKPRTGS